MQQVQLTFKQLAEAALKLGATPNAIRVWRQCGIPHRYQVKLMRIRRAFSARRPALFERAARAPRYRIAVGECSLGSILIAASNNGVCAISFGDEPDTLVPICKTNFLEHS